VPADPVELLDRQHDRVARSEGPEFVHELRRFHELITSRSEAVLQAMNELRAEAQTIEREFEAHDDELVPELVALKQELVARVPEADDSGTARPQSVGAPPMQWSFSFANFDQVASGGPDRNIVRQGWDSSRSGMLLRILEGQLHRAAVDGACRGPEPQGVRDEPSAGPR